MFQFIKKLFKAVVKTITSWFKETVNNAEATVILITASLGLTAIISELPFIIALPLWMEATMVAPILSILTILFLIQIIKFRASHELYIQ